MTGATTLKSYRQRPPRAPRRGVPSGRNQSHGSFGARPRLQMPFPRSWRVRDRRTDRLLALLLRRRDRLCGVLRHREMYLAPCARATRAIRRSRTARLLNLPIRYHRPLRSRGTLGNCTIASAPTAILVSPLFEWLELPQIGWLPTRRQDNQIHASFDKKIRIYPINQLSANRAENPAGHPAMDGIRWLLPALFSYAVVRQSSRTRTGQHGCPRREDNFFHL